MSHIQETGGVGAAGGAGHAGPATKPPPAPGLGPQGVKPAAASASGGIE
jgi:hypothetical protein